MRVGTENRQHVLGHISLLGYSGRIIAPMTTGGPDESALGDPVDCLLMEWARQCRKQGGLVVLPHFPNPRAENAAAVVSGQVHAIEMTSWGNLWGGIDPYSLSDWYRYLNCGYQVAAVGGTDKMAADTAVGTVRTYARIPAGRPFSYDNWMEAVRRAETFVTYGPLLEFMVEGRPMGSQLDLPAGGRDSRRLLGSRIGHYSHQPGRFDGKRRGAREPDRPGRWRGRPLVVPSRPEQLAGAASARPVPGAA